MHLIVAVIKLCYSGGCSMFFGMVIVAVIKFGILVNYGVVLS